MMTSGYGPEQSRRHLQRLLEEQGLSYETVSFFQQTVLGYFREEGRNLPWRQTTDPYHIFVSEVMLQQTQVDRVVEKYIQFIHTFPSFRALAEAHLQKVLEAWQGLGYNRRALSLKKSAEIIETTFGGLLPSEPEQLVTLPGIGRATAASILAFGFDRPVVFIEINIRCVYIFFFFQERNDVHDSELMPIVQTTLDESSPRRWYSALMDYGTTIRKNYADINKRSIHYHRQAPFKGSDRQVRGKILRLLLKRGTLSWTELKAGLAIDDIRLSRIVSKLHTEGFIISRKNRYSISQEVHASGEKD